MKILIACEFTGAVRDAFIAAGHDAISCDLLPSQRPGPHHQGDVLEFVRGHAPHHFDLMVAFPPCTDLAASGARWFPEKRADGRQTAALQFVRDLMALPVARWALENPVGVISTAIRKPDQIIHPWQHGHGETKATCLWLKGLPLLTPTQVVDGRVPRIHRLSPSPERWALRSATYPGIARAMAEQWGAL